MVRLYRSSSSPCRAAGVPDGASSPVSASAAMRSWAGKKPSSSTTGSSPSITPSRMRSSSGSGLYSTASRLPAPLPEPPGAQSPIPPPRFPADIPPGSEKRLSRTAASPCLTSRGKYGRTAPDLCGGRQRRRSASQRAHQPFARSGRIKGITQAERDAHSPMPVAAMNQAVPSR